ncbi:MAG: energy transducer TonB [Deltaproteobacteria bacterium]|nr:energy transducer TonB [Deltaproteobacteria bacterium]MCL4873881.1 TonB family protein [bacterium]
MMRVSRLNASLAFSALFHAGILAFAIDLRPVPVFEPERIAVRFMQADTRTTEPQAQKTAQTAERAAPLPAKQTRAPEKKALPVQRQEPAAALPKHEPAALPDSFAVEQAADPAPALPADSEIRRIEVPPEAEPAPSAAAGAASVSAPEKDEAVAVRLSEYLATVKSAVERNKEYPVFAKQLGIQGTVVIRTEIASDGLIASAAVFASSGHKGLDRSALSAVKASAPFRPPSNFGLGGRVVIDIPMTYVIN